MIERRSLYFNYIAHPFVAPPELKGQRPRHPVAIVGGGPVGLTLALELAARGVRSVVLEAKATVSEGSRAICFSRRTLEILDRLGVAGAVMAKALPWTHGTSYYRDKPVFRLEMAHGADDKFPPMVNLQQCYLEQFLIDRVAAEPLIDLRWQSGVSALATANDHIVLTVGTPEGPYDLEAAYVVAADGARSAVRHALGLELRGRSYEGRYLIADIRLRSSYPTERRAWFDPPSNPGATILMHKQPDDIWRIDYQLRDDQDPETELAEERIRARIAEHLGFIGETGPWELDWYSLYKAHSLCLDAYVHDRVVFAGDAAHLVPIFGVRGLNSGIADANNLGWKLARLIEGTGNPALVASYNPERRAATLDIFAQAGKSTVFMTPPSRGYALMREAALALAVTEPFTRPLINPRQSEPFYYRESPLNTADDPAFSAGPPPGALLPGCRLADGSFLIDRLGHEFTVLTFGAQDLNAAMAELCRTQPDITHLDLRAAPDAFRQACDAGPETVYVLRPDQHVLARWRTLAAADASAYVEAAIARGTKP